MLHKEYEVWITCNGEPLPEYSTQLEGDDQKTSACFIPSESGKEFVIHWRDHLAHNTLNITFKLDGHALAHCSLNDPGSTGKKAGIRSRPGFEQPFQFADLRTSDDDALLSQLAQNAHLGTIEVGLKRVHSEGHIVPWIPDSFNVVGAVHERSKKAGAHNIALGQGLTVEPWKNMWVHEPIDRNEGYVAIFIFRYRPRALLQAQGIMPPATPQLEPNPSQVKQERKRPGPPENRIVKRPRVEPGSAAKSDSKVIDLSDDDSDGGVEALQRKLKRIQEQLDRVTRKNKPPTPGGSRVKREPDTSISVNRGSDDDEVIDLTLDD